MRQGRSSVVSRVRRVRVPCEAQTGPWRSADADSKPADGGAVPPGPAEWGHRPKGGRDVRNVEIRVRVPVAPPRGRRPAGGHEAGSLGTRVRFPPTPLRRSATVQRVLRCMRCSTCVASTLVVHVPRVRSVRYGLVVLTIGLLLVTGLAKHLTLRQLLFTLFLAKRPDAVADLGLRINMVDLQLLAATTLAARAVCGNPCSSTRCNAHPIRVPLLLRVLPRHRGSMTGHSHPLQGCASGFDSLLLHYARVHQHGAPVGIGVDRWRQPARAPPL